MTEEQKRRAMLAYFAEHAGDPSCELTPASTIGGISEVEHERIFEFLQRTNCVTGKIHRFLGGGHLIIGNATSKGIELHHSGAPFEPSTMQTFNISNATNVVAGNQNAVNQTIHQSIQALVTQIENSQGSLADKEEAKGLLRKFLQHPLVTAIAGGVAGAAMGL